MSVNTPMEERRLKRTHATIRLGITAAFIAWMGMYWANCGTPERLCISGSGMAAECLKALNINDLAREL